jgi:hypothetical protein
MEAGEFRLSVESGRDRVVGLATRYGLNGPGIEFRFGPDFPHASGAQPASYTWVSSLAVKWPGHCIKHPPPSRAVKWPGHVIKHPPSSRAVKWPGHGIKHPPSSRAVKWPGHSIKHPPPSQGLQNLFYFAT